MHDVRWAARKNPVHRSHARPGCADLNVMIGFGIAKRKTAGTSERRSGTVLRRGSGKTTRRDQRALKGKKPHERCLVEPVDGLLSKGSSASVGRTGDDGSFRGAEKQWSRDTAPKRTPKPNDAADSTIWKDVARDLAKKFTRPSQ